MKNIAIKFSFLMILLCLLLFPMTFSSATAQEEVLIENKALSVLSELTDFQTESYNTLNVSLKQESFLTLPKQTTDTTLTSDEGNLRVRCSFVNDCLQQIFVVESTGKNSITSKAADVIADATVFLQNYQTYTKNAFYGNLNEMLNTVKADQNVSKVKGNIELDITSTGTCTDIVWTFIDENGIKAPVKNVALSYDNDVFRSFTDNWQFYNIVSVPKITKETAIDLALNITAGFSLSAVGEDGKEVVASDFKVESVGEPSLVYLNFREGNAVRSGDPFMLYPCWYVPVGFDEAYFDGVTGLYIRFWADTGEVCNISPMTIAGTSPLSSQTGVADSDSTALQESTARYIAIPVTIVIFACCLVAFYLHSNKSAVGGFKYVQKRSLRYFAGLLCALMLSGLVCGVQAVPGSVIYASTHNQFDGEAGIYGTSPYEGYYFDGSQMVFTAVYDEPGAAEDVATFLEGIFEDYGGYADSTYNNFGPLTYRENILYYTEFMEENYNKVATFYFGHHKGANNYWCGNGTSGSQFYGYNVTSTEIGERTTGNTFFAWSWVCQSAEDQGSGLPVAWSHDQLNDGSHCYMGFSGASPSLSAVSFNETTALGMDFIMWFYYYAVYEEMPIYAALSYASDELFGVPFNYSPLCEGYLAYWPHVVSPGPPPYTGWYPGQMRVYGNVNLHLSFNECFVDVVDSYGGGAFSIDYPEKILGLSDQQYTHLTATSYDSYAYILASTAYFDSYRGLYIRVHSDLPTTLMYVYVPIYDPLFGTIWYPVYGDYVTNTSDQDIYLGDIPYPLTIAICVYDYDGPCSLYIDNGRTYQS